MTARFFNLPRFAVFDTDTGDPLEGGKVYFFENGTSTEKTIYTDYARTVEATNPVTLDARGEGIAVLGAGYYTIEVRKADDATVVYNEDDQIAADELLAIEGDKLDILLDTDADGATEAVRIYKNATTVGAATIMATLGDVLQTTGGLGVFGTTAPGAQPSHIANPSTTTTPITLTYSAGDPGTVADGAVTFANGGVTPLDAEFYEFFDEVEAAIGTLKTDVDNINTAVAAINAVLEGAGLKASA